MIDRVACWIWAIALRDLYGADARSQKPKYHIQTIRPFAARDGDRLQRHPHDVQALFAYYDHRNSLHTNAYDEAITTPTEASVRRADGDPAHHHPRAGAYEDGEHAAGAAISSTS